MNTGDTRRSILSGLVTVILLLLVSCEIDPGLRPSDGTDGDLFGCSVAISGDGNIVVVGAVGDDGYGNMSGAAYVFRRSETSWEETKLTPSDPAADRWFGVPVAISDDGNTVVVGSAGAGTDRTSSGTVHIYRWSGNEWVETEISASDPYPADFYGRSVSISNNGETVVVGSATHNAAYAYRWSGATWSETKLVGSDAGADYHFGERASVSADGNTIVVGVESPDEPGETLIGNAYVYHWSGTDWEEEKIIASEICSPSAVAVSETGDVVVVGDVLNDSVNGVDSGAAYVYEWTGTSWEETKITASDGSAEDRFGRGISVSDDGNTIVIGASSADVNVNNSGSVYVYQRSANDWIESKVVADNLTEGSWFGGSVDLMSDGTTLVVGAEGGRNGLGAAYVFELADSGWEEESRAIRY